MVNKELSEAAIKKIVIGIIIFAAFTLLNIFIKTEQKRLEMQNRSAEQVENKGH